nr:unnamed protein product [Digitaria exilis]
MAPAASEEREEKEQGKEEADTATPEAPERQQDVASMIGRRTKKQIEEAISLMRSCYMRVS